MAQKTNNFERFWRELKRRKVVHVITVYAAIAFVILQLVDMVAEPLRLPVSTKALVIVLLCIGFIISVFVSWVYDITPGGVKRTKPVTAAKHIDQASIPTSRGWKITTYISAVIIVALVAINFISKKNFGTGITKLEKSIAVLPFRNDSPSDSNQYFINGIMDEILNNLQMIKDFRVLSRTSTEQYRGSNKLTVPKIAKELAVNYIVEGSGQKYGNRFRLRVQLIAAYNEKHLWAESYEQEIKETKDIFKIQSQIAQSIASELKATITPEEKGIIGKTPTTNLTAYDFYQRGKDELAKYPWPDQPTPEALRRAVTLFQKALVYDSTFAQAYIGLADVLWIKHDRLTDITDNSKLNNYRDSMLILADIALSYNDKLPDSYVIKGAYYYFKFNYKKAIDELDKAIEYNPNDGRAYRAKGMVYHDFDIVKTLENYQKAASLDHGPDLPSTLNILGGLCYSAGFPEKAKYYYLEALKLDGDSIKYLSSLAEIEHSHGNYKKSLEFLEKINAIDTTYDVDSRLALNYLFTGQFEKSLKYVKKWIDSLRATKQIIRDELGNIGYIYWVNGNKKEAEYYFDKQVEYCLDNIKKYDQNANGVFYTYYDLAGVYAFRGEKEKAYKSLRIYNQSQRIDFYMLMLIKSDPLFNNIRKEPEFQQIVRDVEAKYQAEHERVRKWLEETGQL